MAVEPYQQDYAMVTDSDTGFLIKVSKRKVGAWNRNPYRVEGGNVVDYEIFAPDCDNKWRRHQTETLAISYNGGVYVPIDMCYRGACSHDRFRGVCVGITNRYGISLSAQTIGEIERISEGWWRSSPAEPFASLVNIVIDKAASCQKHNGDGGAICLLAGLNEILLDWISGLLPSPATITAAANAMNGYQHVVGEYGRALQNVLQQHLVSIEHEIEYKEMNEKYPPRGRRECLNVSAAEQISLIKQSISIHNHFGENGYNSIRC